MLYDIRHHSNYNHKKRIILEDMPLKVAGIVSESVVDGANLRFVIFTQGCFHNCKNCHNPETHDPSGGTWTTTAELWKKIEASPLIKGITFSGGEPFLWGRELAQVGGAALEWGLDIVTYTGYTYEALLSLAKQDKGVHELLSVTNYLIDGAYIDSLRDLTLKFRGSKNQRILDITCYPNSKNAVDVTDVYQ